MAQAQEEKTFTQYFMPYKHVGRVKNATKDAAVNIELAGGILRIKAYASGKHAQVTIQVTQGENVLFTDTAPLSPVEIYDGTFPTDLETLSGCSVSIKMQTEPS